MIKKSFKINLPWPNGTRRGFGIGSDGFDPKSRRKNYDGVPLGKVHFLA